PSHSAPLQLRIKPAPDVDIDAPLFPAPAAVRRLFNPSLIENVVRVEESAFAAIKLKARMGARPRARRSRTAALDDRRARASIGRRRRGRDVPSERRLERLHGGSGDDLDQEVKYGRFSTHNMELSVVIA